MQRYIVPQEASRADGSVWLAGDDFHHLTRVMRLRAGDEVIVSSGGSSSVCRIAAVEADGARLEPVRACGRAETALAVTWLQGLPKGDKIDLVIRHACEIGARSLWVFAAKRSVAALPPDRVDGRLVRWRRMAKEGSELAQRDDSLEVHYFSSLSAAIAAIPTGIPLLVPYEAQDRGLPGARLIFAQLPLKEAAVSFVIGPEGGFAPDEIQSLETCGGILFTLGPRVFRTETAGMVTASALFYERGELGGSE